MIIFPAIDLKDGACVRLVKGDYDTAHKVAEDPIQTAKSFEEAGATWIHMVDLDGAKAQKPVNHEVITQVARNTDLKVEVGGGIRDMETIDFYLHKGGASRVILGSAALKNPLLVEASVKKYKDKIAVGIDALHGKVAAEGWTDCSEVDYLDLARRMEKTGVATLIFTDISRDGTLTGPNLDMLRALQEAVSCDIIASGGVSNIQDIENLQELGLYGAICGKALYTGDLSLYQAIVVGRG